MRIYSDEELTMMKTELAKEYILNITEAIKKIKEMKGSAEGLINILDRFV